MRITILGDGQMGLVLAQVLTQAAQPERSAMSSDAGTPPELVLWGHDPHAVQSLAQTRSSRRLPGFSLPEAVRVTESASGALEEADLIVAASPTQFLRSVWTRVRDRVPPPDRAGIVSVAKGVENDTLLRPTQVLREVLADDPDAAARPIAVLSGPTIAAELARCLPATMLAASDDAELARRVQRLFTTTWLRVYTSTDPLGVELAGATKNVIAIAAGIIDGLQAGFNAKSALLARGLAEIARLGAAMGASPETFFGIAGAGDLATSCFSPQGRNRSCGEALGKGRSLDEIIASTHSVVEGVATTRSVIELAKRYRVDMPITSAVHAVLYESVDPIDAISALMSREMKEERIA